MNVGSSHRYQSSGANLPLMAGWADCRLHILGQGPWGKERTNGESMWTAIYEQSELNNWTMQELIFESMPWPDWTVLSLLSLWRTISRQTKSEINSLFPHTWLAHGCRREQGSACRCREAWLWLKVKHLLFTQSGFLLMKSELGSQVEAARLRSDMCSFFSVPAGGEGGW